MKTRDDYTATGLVCTQGHVVVSDRHGSLFCLECNRVQLCRFCGWSGDKSQVSWVGSQVKSMIEGTLYNWRDGGLYGQCPNCERVQIVAAYPASWIDARYLARDVAMYAGQPWLVQALCADGVRVVISEGHPSLTSASEVALRLWPLMDRAQVVGIEVKQCRLESTHDEW